jgi:tetratricopeptide (TPR) repeat protein
MTPSRGACALEVNCALTPRGENLHFVLLGLDLSAARGARAKRSEQKFGVLSLSVTVEPIAAPLSAPPAPAPGSSGSWIYGPWLDLLIGCGAWSAPLLAVALLMTPAHTHAWAMTFYLLAIVFNYPHFMATIYRAYHTRADFEKYKFVTLHVTLLLVLTGIVMHTSPRFFPWLFTLYICWSPWHYSGQNYGLLMMFARRSGAEITAGERRWLRGAFVASYLMLLASFETGGSTDPLILSLGLPAKITFPLRVAFGVAFAIFTFFGFRRLLRTMGARALVAPLTLAFTQFLWFVLPTLLELNSVSQVPQTRYSSGILAVLHSAQYIWITSYYQRREARAAGQKNWHIAAYFATLVAGGIALFIPGPWLVSYLFRYDFTTSFLIFVSLVNIHHFILDAKLWKLRDKRVAALLVDQSGNAPATAADASLPPAASSARAFALGVLSAPAFRVSLAVLLFLWGGFDQFHFALRTAEGNLPALLRAAQINPYDSFVEERIARAETQQGQSGQAVAALTRAVALNPSSITLQQAAARALIADGRYAEAYAHYQKMLERFPRDSDALTNYGLLAARLGHPEEAMDSWEKSVDVNPDQPNAQLYLAEAYDQRGEPVAAARHWNLFLEYAGANPQAATDAPAFSRAQILAATIQLGDDESRINHSAAALARYDTAIAQAQQAGDAKLESLALVHRADLQARNGDAAAAAQSYQRGLALDAQAGDTQAAALDWFNYGQFLRSHNAPDELAYVAFLHAENLLNGASGSEPATVQTARRQVESKMGAKAVSVAQKDLAAQLQRAEKFVPAVR